MNNALNIQGDQLYMAVCFWYLVGVYSILHWTSHFLQGSRKHGHVYLVRLYVKQTASIVVVFGC